MRILNKIIWSVVLIGSLAAFSGCRTANGFGQDMEKAGEKIQEKTDK